MIPAYRTRRKLGMLLMRTQFVIASPPQADGNPIRLARAVGRSR